MRKKNIVDDEIKKCVKSPVRIVVSSDYIGPGNSEFKYTTIDTNVGSTLFGCINAIRGETLIINVEGEDIDVSSHPMKITDYNDLAQSMAPFSGVEKKSFGSSYRLSWRVPDDPNVDKYQYQSETSAGMRGTINVSNANSQSELCNKDAAGISKTSCQVVRFFNSF